MKESYERTELEIIKYQQEDVILTSGEDPLDPSNDKYVMPIRG